MNHSSLISLVSFLLIFSTSPGLFAQFQKIEAYVFETGNRGYLNQVNIKVFDESGIEVIEQGLSNKDGFISMELPANKVYKLVAKKEMFHEKELVVDLSNSEIGETNYLKIEMQRAPGYVFEITLAEQRETDNNPVDALKGALIEVYNNTTKKEVLVLKDHPHPDFRVGLKKGNHYTLLIRKKGFLSKRLEAFVDVEGCILCFEGLGKLTPGVTDNLSEGNSMGVLLANVEMERIFTGKKMQINNLYYDLGKHNLKPKAKEELDNVIRLIDDNPDIRLELGSHTDSRGSDEFNLNLSDRRAATAVRYILSNIEIDDSRLISKGYGETQLVNECKNGVDCEEDEHALNRRTELKILGTLEVDKEFVSLYKLKQEELKKELIKDLLSQEQVVINEEDETPDFLKETKSIEDEAISIDENPARVNSDYDKNTVHTGLPDSFKIVIKESSERIAIDDILYERHANLMEYFESENKILYMFGQFNDKQDALEFLMLSRKMYPNAYLVYIENGKLKRI